MLRFGSAIEGFDPFIHPWKIDCLHEWYCGLFLPGIHEHHDLEEKIFFPEYKKLGAKMPEKLAKDHVHLMAELKSVGDQLNAMKESGLSCLFPP